jgi:hypothetical protein
MYEHEGVEIEILVDEDMESSNPRQFDGNYTELYIYSRGYTLGDHQLEESGLPEIECPTCHGACVVGDQEDDCIRCGATGTVDPFLSEWLVERKALAVAPLFLHDHSILSIKVGDITVIGEQELKRVDTDSRGRFAGDGAGWDTSFCGFAIITEERWEVSPTEKPMSERLTEAIEVEVEVYDQYLRGEVYGYIVARGTPFEESCWGYLGGDTIRDEAQRSAEYVAERLALEKQERAEMAARDIETVEA